MGVDLIAEQFLAYAKKKQNFGRTVTIGRQKMDVDPPDQIRLARKLGISNYDVSQKYAESLLIQGLGAACAESLDASPYEGATIIHDLNLPFRESPPVFDTIIDCGTLEHVFNIPQALLNLSQLCSEKGQILHVVPGTNYLGHGLYQFSPELFFSYYSAKNGYRDTEIYLANTSYKSYWYRVFPPQNGERHEILTPAQFLVCVRTVKDKTSLPSQGVQQSDYLHVWEHGSDAHDGRIKLALKRNPAVYYRLKTAVNTVKTLKRQMLGREIHYVNERSSTFEKVKLSHLLGTRGA